MRPFRGWLGTLILLFTTIPGVPCFSEDSGPVFHLDDSGRFIRAWLVCGPFPNHSRKVGSSSIENYTSPGFYRDFLEPAGGEGEIRPSPGDRVIDPETGKEHIWRPLRSEKDLISFEKVFHPNDNVVAYAYTEVIAPTTRKVVLSLGSNDGIRVFLNGELVHSHLVLRWLGKDTDYVPVTLKKGRNRLLIKVDEAGGDWGFSARFLDFEKTIQDLRDNLPRHSELRVVTRDDHLAAFFGQPYRIETLNPGARVQVDVTGETGELLARLSGRCGKAIRFPVSGFPEGPLHFKARFPLGDGTFAEAERGHFVGKLPRHKPPATIGSDLAFRREGKPFLPIGIYAARPEEYSLLKQAGFNFVVASASNLDRVHEAGLLASVGFHGDSEEYLHDLEQTIRQYKSHPAVLCWMLADEPGYNRMDLLNLHRAYELVHRTDPIHPSYLVITDPRVYRTFGRCCDVLAIDTYPVSKKLPINDVGENIAKAYRQSDGDLPIWHCGQLFAWPSDRVPTPEENRYMTYLALLNGAKGLLWYGMHWFGTSLREAAPELWKEHLNLIAEIRSLERFFIAPGFGESLAVQDTNGGVRARSKRTKEGEQLILALNTSRDTTSKAVLPAEGESVLVVGEERTIPIRDGSFEDRFDPLSVHLYLVR